MGFEMLLPALLLLVALSAVFFFIGRNAGQNNGGPSIEHFQHILNKEITEQTERLVENIGRVREESRVAIGDSFGAAQKNLTESLAHGEKELAETLGKTQALVTERLEKLLKESGEIKSASGKLLEVGSDIRKLSDILQGPKGRGGFGEFQLELLLSQAVPADRFALQYKIGEGTVDAAILLKDAVLCIDSKFPLANLKKYYEAEESSPEREKLLSAFHNDVKNRAREIAKKYIAPPKTLEFAVMFIPAEAVFLEVVSNTELHADLTKMRVVPASPNFLYIYFQALAIGFRGMAVEAQAREILGALAELKAHFGKFQDSFGKLGTHIKNASGQYADAEKQSTRIQQTLDNLRLGQTTNEPPAP